MTTGCTGPQAPPSSVSSLPSASASSAPSSPQTAVAPMQARLPQMLGRIVTLSEVELTVHGWTPLAGARDQMDYTIAVQVELCARTELMVGWDGWTVTDDAGGVLSPVAPSADLPGATLPWWQRLAAGSCLDGWLAFETNSGLWPTQVNYASAAGERATWSD